MAAPTRPGEQVVGAYVPIILSGKEYRLRELPTRVNRDWQRRLAQDVRGRLSEVGTLDTADEVIDAIADSAELMMDLLIAYDLMGTDAWNRLYDTADAKALPDRDFIDTRATDRECYEAIKRVTEVSFPFGADLLRIVPEIRPALLQAVSRGVAAATVTMISSRSTSSAPPSTAGSPTTLSAA